jgi:hypothetical protein
MVADSKESGRRPKWVGEGGLSNHKEVDMMSESYSLDELKDMFELELDDYGPVEVLGYEYSVSRVLKLVDEVAYNEEFNNWLDACEFDECELCYNYARRSDDGSPTLCDDCALIEEGERPNDPDPEDWTYDERIHG